MKTCKEDEDRHRLVDKSVARKDHHISEIGCLEIGVGEMCGMALNWVIKNDRQYLRGKRPESQRHHCSEGRYISR